MDPRVVVVGAGFGGLSVARRLGGAPLQVTLIDRNNYHLFQPLLYQVSTAALSPAQIARPIRSILRRHRNVEVFMAEVTAVDLEGRRVLTSERDVPYDSLVLAPGSRHSYFGHPEWERFAPGLKTIEDAVAIRRKILLAFERAEVEPDRTKVKSLLTFVLVGAGPTGVEMAGAIAEIARAALARDFRHIDPASARIVLAEASPRILPAFPEELSQSAREELERYGVEIRTGRAVEDVNARGVVIGGELLEAATVIWTAGVEAAPVGKWLGAEVDRQGRVSVGEDLSIPGRPEVFVIGDAARALSEGKPLPGLAPVAMQEGRYVADLILRRLRGEAAAAPFRYVDKGVLTTVGRAFAVAAFRKVRLAGFFAWLAWVVVHIYYLIGFRNRLLVLFEWSWAYLTFQRGARLITREKPEPSPR